VNDNVLLNQYGAASQKRFGRLFDVPVMVERLTNLYEKR
jgi:hypothetical protein